jgi:hypothetical protein
MALQTGNFSAGSRLDGWDDWELMIFALAIKTQGLPNCKSNFHIEAETTAASSNVMTVD